MKYLKRYIFIFLICMIFLSGNASAQVRVSAQVDDSRDIYAGQDFLYLIYIEGSSSIGQPDLGSIEQFNPRGAGTSQETSIINGDVRSFISLRYALKATKEGEMEIPPVIVPVEGKKYQTNPVRIDVVKPGTTNRLDLEVELSEKKCYVGQPVLITIKFYYYGQAYNWGPSIPVFTSEDFDLDEPDIPLQQVQPARLSNGITLNLVESTVIRNNRETNLVAFSKILIPKRSGIIDIGEITMEVDIPTGIQNERFKVSANPGKLEVLPLPEQGKPDNFYGLVGDYSIESIATPTEVSVGDPITLNIRIGSNKYLKPVQWPDLKQIPEFENNFKIPSEQASPVVENGSKIFTQTIRASNEKVKEIPPISLSYFDTDKGAYVTAKTKPIKLEVSPTKILTGSDLLGSDFSPMNKEVEAVKQGLSANYQDMDALRSHDFSPIAAIVSPGYLVLWAGPLGFLLFSAFTKIASSTSPEKQLQKRKRGASGKAIGKLKGISNFSSSEHIEELAAILKQYIGDRFDRTAGSLTSDDCYNVIIEASGDTETAQQFKNIIADCEASRYASAGANIDSQCVNKAIDLILTIEKKIEK